MRDKIELTGIILSSTTVGDYDKRLVLYTKERGKITAFAKGARKPNSPYMGISEPFNFGVFTLLEGYDAYRLLGGEIREYFLDVKNDIEGICYGTYFCDILEYLCVDGIGDIQILNLIFVTLKALQKPDIPNPLIRCIFELRILQMDGEGMVAFTCAVCRKKEHLKAFSLQENGMVCDACTLRSCGRNLTESTIYTIQFILSTPLDKLYSFRVAPEVMQELSVVTEAYFQKHVTKKFNSLEILTSLS